MEPILNNRLLDVNNVQSILGIPTTGKSDVVCFLEDLYTYPPKIKIQWKQLQSDSASQPNTLEALGASNKVVRNKRQPSLPKYFSRFNDYVATSISSNFYKRKTKVIREALKTIPVYVIMNGNNELVLATALSGHVSGLRATQYDDAYNFPIADSFSDDQKINVAGKKFIGRKDKNPFRVTRKALISPKKKFGFIFFDRDEAELHLNSIILDSAETVHGKRSLSLDKVGLSIHCIGLDAAYDLVTRTLTTRDKSAIDFRFVPSLTEISTLLKSSDQKDFNKTLAKLVSTEDPHRNNSCFKGVPIYFVQVQNVPRSFIPEGILNIDRLFDSLVGIPKILSGTRLNNINEFKRSAKSNPDGIVNYVLFDREQAIDFVQKLHHRVKLVPNSSKVIDLLDLASVSTYNLEDFLELWEESILLKSDSNNSKFVINENQPVYFIPSKRSAKVLEEYHNKPKKFIKEICSIMVKKET
jgi:hypothetical protein